LAVRWWRTAMKGEGDGVVSVRRRRVVIGYGQR
jgi:hypothetical protein